ncbi:hypothetical protein CPter291_2607 [Collimonas pratensis]|uniref:Uncharacterized protein n=1 Tax=Collimonas pratensis TaxID=279113 RepID=A0ABN4MAL1_9BURK|nr:hypothetical protein CPter291_2607 [Collimonas pratensis]
MNPEAWAIVRIIGGSHVEPFFFAHLHSAVKTYLQRRMEALNMS